VTGPSIIRMINSRRVKWTWHVANMWEKRNTCRILVGMPVRKTPLCRFCCRLEDLREIVSGSMDCSWSQLPRGLRHELSSLARTLEPWVRIPLETWTSVFVYSAYWYRSCDGLIPHQRSPMDCV
jgi:hypothetical protein